MSARAWAIATAIFGAATVAMFVVFAMQPQMRAAAGCLPPGSVIQFELARTPADLAAIFGAPESACRPLAVAAMDAVNRLDVAAFIPIYTLFCICGAFFLSGGALRLLSVAAALAALGAAAGDYLETTTLLKITPMLDDPYGLDLYLSFDLPVGARSKFALLALHGVFCAGMCFTGAARRPILGALLCAPVLGVAAAAYDHSALSNVLNGAFAAAWFALLAFAVRAAFQRARPAL